MAQDRVVVVNGARTPFARSRTVFRKMPPSALARRKNSANRVRSSGSAKTVMPLFMAYMFKWLLPPGAWAESTTRPPTATIFFSSRW